MLFVCRFRSVDDANLNLAREKPPRPPPPPRPALKPSKSLGYGHLVIKPSISPKPTLPGASPSPPIRIKYACSL